MRIIETELGNTPARVNRRTGDIYINSKIWQSIPEKQRKFILLHEIGHYKLDTSNEIAADDFAFRNFAGTEKYSLKSILHAIADNLDIEHNSEHRKRYNIIARKLLEFDAEHNNNKEAKKILEKMENQEYINTLPEASQKALITLLVDFLHERGIQKLSVLPEDERQELMIEFMHSPEVVYLLARTTELSTNNFVGISKDDAKGAMGAGVEEAKHHHGLGGIIGSIVGAGASLVAGAFGVPIPPTIGASLGGMIGGAIDRGHHNHNHNQQPHGPASPPPDPDKLAWQQAMSQGTEKAYRIYLSRFPSGKYSGQAKRKINEFIEKDWQAAKSANTVEAYQAYLTKRPQSPHTQEAQAAIKKLKEKKMMIIGGGIAAVAIIIVSIFVFKHR